MKKIFYLIFMLSLFNINESVAAGSKIRSAPQGERTEANVVATDAFPLQSALNGSYYMTIENLWDYYVAQSEYINPAFASVNCYGETGIALGTSGTYAGKTVYKSGTGGNNYYFTIQGSNFGANLSWSLPTAAPGGANYLLNVDADGTMGYTDPASISGTVTDLDDLPGDTVDNNLIDGAIVQTNTATSAGIVASGAAQVSKVWKTDADGVPGWRDDALNFILLDNITWGAAAGGSQTWTFDTGAATDPSVTISDTYFTFNKVLQCAGIETTRSATLGGSTIIGYEGSNNGDNYIGYKAPDSRATTLIYLEPTSDPTAGQVKVWGVPSDNVSTGTWATPVVEGTGTGGVILGDSTPDSEGETGYASNQLSIHDGTASRSILQVASTTITKSEFLPIRYSEDGTTAPAAAAEIGTTAVIARSFLEDADNDVWFNWLVPLDYSAGLKYRVIYAIQTDADADETVAFSLAGCSTADTEAMACSEGTAVVVTDELTTDFDAAETIITGWSDAVTVTGIAAGEFARLHFLRDVSGDDYAGANDNTLVIGIEIKYQAKINASGDY